MQLQSNDDRSGEQLKRREFLGMSAAAVLATATMPSLLGANENGSEEKPADRRAGAGTVETTHEEAGTPGVAKEHNQQRGSDGTQWAEKAGPYLCYSAAGLCGLMLFHTKAIFEYGTFWKEGVVNWIRNQVAPLRPGGIPDGEYVSKFASRAKMPKADPDPEPLGIIKGERPPELMQLTDAEHEELAANPKRLKNMCRWMTMTGYMLPVERSVIVQVLAAHYDKHPSVDVARALLTAGRLYADFPYILFGRKMDKPGDIPGYFATMVSLAVKNSVFRDFLLEQAKKRPAHDDPATAITYVLDKVGLK